MIEGPEALTHDAFPASVPLADEFAKLAEISTRRRAEMGIGPDGRAVAASPTDRRAGAGAASTFSASIALGGQQSRVVRVADPNEHEDLARVPLPPWSPEARAFLGKGVYDCLHCKEAKVPGPGLCASCFGKWKRCRRQDAIDALMRERLPEIHWDCSWEALPGLRDKYGALRVRANTEWVAVLRTRMEHRLRTFIYGPAGEGKSTVAACYLRAGIERGESVAFVLARDLQDDVEGRALYDRVANADKLVLDDLGGETQGARIGGDVAAIRSKLTVQLLLHRFGHKLDTVMTFGRPIEALVELYDAGVTRRILDGALQLPLGSFD